MDVASAATADEEAAAFRRVAETTTEYRVTIYSPTGAEIPMNLVEDRRKASTVRIEWPNGEAVTRRLIDPSNLDLLMRD